MPQSGNTISFFSDGISFSLRDRNATRDWLKRVAASHRKKIDTLNYVFVSDRTLLKINRQFLNHDTFTDIITFPGEPSARGITGEIYISIDRVRENARQYKQSAKSELARVMAHGLLHLCGFKDKSVSDARTMRSQEEKALDLRIIIKR